jgi:hypothetical protein
VRGKSKTAFQFGCDESFPGDHHSMVTTMNKSVTEGRAICKRAPDSQCGEHLPHQVVQFVYSPTVISISNSSIVVGNAPAHCTQVVSPCFCRTSMMPLFKKVARWLLALPFLLLLLWLSVKVPALQPLIASFTSDFAVQVAVEYVKKRFHIG